MEKHGQSIHFYSTTYTLHVTSLRKNTTSWFACEGEGWLGKITQINWKFSDGHYSVKATTLLFYVDAIFLLFWIFILFPFLMFFLCFSNTVEHQNFIVQNVLELMIRYHSQWRACHTYNILTRKIPFRQKETISFIWKCSKVEIDYMILFLYWVHFCIRHTVAHTGLQ